MNNKEVGMSDQVDLSEFVAAARPTGYGCWYSTIEFTPEQRAKIDAALGDQSIPNTAIARVLTNWGYRKGDAAVRNHRIGSCSCNG